jgi:hypothetical protein
MEEALARRQWHRDFCGDRRQRVEFVRVGWFFEEGRTVRLGRLRQSHRRVYRELAVTVEADLDLVADYRA